MSAPALLLAAAAAHATGLPAHEALRVVDPGCSPREQGGAPLRITFGLQSGACAPGGPCSVWIERDLDPTALVVRRVDCAEPFVGGWVPDGACGAQPAWRWTGRLDPGHAHDIGRDFQGGMARLTVTGDTSGAAYPPESARRDPTRTPAAASGAQPPQWLTFPASGYRVALGAGGASLRWTPGPALRQWVNGDADAVAESDPMPPAQAHAWLAGARVEPGGLAVRHTVVAHREWFEGWRQRSTGFCERVLEMDVEQRLQPAAEGGLQSPPMRVTVRLRDPAPLARCGGDAGGR